MSSGKDSKHPLIDQDGVFHQKKQGISGGEEKKRVAGANRLIHESSPYLLLHAYNPVDWRPWGVEALERAREEKKLLIVSIGYAACHWCHVMEEESFTDAGVAGVMNEFFISVKVDREERPDIDQVYMSAAQLITGGGGWPLNVVCMPDGRPIFAGTYFPREQWFSLLQRIRRLYAEDPVRLAVQAEAVTQGIRATEIISASQPSGDFKPERLRAVVEGILSGWDFQWGGYGGAPKFPMPVISRFLLDYHHVSGDRRALSAVNVMLERMDAGGIHDQIGGGFARYSVDAYWKAPHFEKMLYDNAQLVSLYAQGFRLTGEPLHRRAVYETLSFVERELSAPEGGFYSSLDADSEGEEGRYYVWSRQEFREVLGEDSDRVEKFYHVTSGGNWEPDRNILFRDQNRGDFAQAHRLTEEQWEKILFSAHKRLMKRRSLRTPPALDDKVLTAWNALMIEALVDAHRVFDDVVFLRRADRAVDFLTRSLIRSDGGLFRSYKNGKASINGFLDDYAFTIRALISYYQAVFREEPLYLALKLTEYVNRHFYDQEIGMYYYTSELDARLIARKMELNDNVIPSSASVMAMNCFLLGHYFQRDDLVFMARRMAQNVEGEMVRNGAFYANWAVLYRFFTFPVFEVSVIGPQWNEVRKRTEERLPPGVILSGGADGGTLPLLKGKYSPGKTLIYVCRDKTCLLPCTDVSSALALMK